ncbi:MAG: hypothetical protein AAF420_11575 [Pseudomonadota bacterium]
MIPKSVRVVTGLIGLFIVGAFVLGLAHSISVGFAGILGGLPFVVIAVFVLGLAAYDYWDECIRVRRK